MKKTMMIALIVIIGWSVPSFALFEPMPAEEPYPDYNLSGPNMAPMFMDDGSELMDDGSELMMGTDGRMYLIPGEMPDPGDDPPPPNRDL